MGDCGNFGTEDEADNGSGPPSFLAKHAGEEPTAEKPTRGAEFAYVRFVPVVRRDRLACVARTLMRL